MSNKRNCTNCGNFICAYQGMENYNNAHCDIWISNKGNKKMKKKIIKLSDYKRNSCELESHEEWVKRFKERMKNWYIDFDAEIKNNAHTIPEKIAVFIWEHTGKTGYNDIEFSVEMVFYTIYSFLSLILIGIFLVFTIIGLEKLYLLLHS